MEVLEVVGTVLGGGALGLVASEIRKAYTARVSGALEGERIATGRAGREQDVTARLLRRRDDQHAGCLERVEQLHGELLTVSKGLAKCEASHASTNSRLNELRKFVGLDPAEPDDVEGEPAE